MNKEDEWVDFCNNWRTLYDRMSPQNHIEMNDLLFREYPEQEQHQEQYVSHFISRFIPPVELNVIEFGGFNGELARKIIAMGHPIRSWDNYELTNMAIDFQTCKDNRYMCFLCKDKFLWELPPAKNHNMFTSCHAIEHLNDDDCKKLLSWIKDSSFEYVFMEVYVDLYIEDTPEAKQHHYDHFYMGTVSTHILTMGWNEINAIMIANGFKQVYHPHNTVFAYTRRL